MGSRKQRWCASIGRPSSASWPPVSPRSAATASDAPSRRTVGASRDVQAQQIPALRQALYFCALYRWGVRQSLFTASLCAFVFCFPLVGAEPPFSMVTSTDGYGVYHSDCTEC